MKKKPCANNCGDCKLKNDCKNSEFKSKEIKLGKGELQIITIKFNNIPTMPNEPDEDFEDDNDDLKEFEL